MQEEHHAAAPNGLGREANPWRDPWGSLPTEGSSLLLLKRGWGEERSQGRLWLPKLDYAQTVLVSDAAGSVRWVLWWYGLVLVSLSQLPAALKFCRQDLPNQVRTLCTIFTGLWWAGLSLASAHSCAPLGSP